MSFQRQSYHPSSPCFFSLKNGVCMGGGGGSVPGEEELGMERLQNSKGPII